jgi:hypothetical protein
VKKFIEIYYLLFSNATPYCWNWGSVTEKRRRGRCGNYEDKVRGGDAVVGEGLSRNGDKNPSPFTSSLEMSDVPEFDAELWDLPVLVETGQGVVHL